MPFILHLKLIGFIHRFYIYFAGCSLHICGSTCNGLATNESDIDLCLLLTETRKV